MTSKIVIDVDLIKKAKLQAEADLLRSSFPEFAARAWREIDPAPLQKTWFLDLFWEELERWGRNEPGYSHLLLAMPPGASKSLSASVLLQAWMWTRDPSFGTLAVGPTGEIATRDTLRTRDLVTCDWYRERFWDGWSMSNTQNAKQYFKNTAYGYRKAFGANASRIGWRSEISILDDLVKFDPAKPPKEEDYHAAFRLAVNVLFTRVNNPNTSKGLVIAQRLHDLDPIGQLLKKDPDKWRAVFFDARYDSRMPHRHPKDPRREEGELLLPYLHTDEFLQSLKTQLGSDFYAAQYQQTPAIAGGMIIHENWLQRYDDDERPPPDTSYTIVSWDFPQKGAATSSWVVGSVWGVECPDDPYMRRFVLKEVVREHLDYPGMKRAVERLSIRYPEADLTIVEDKAAGPHLISELKHKIPTIVPFLPDKFGDKEQRLKSVSPVFEAGKVFVPASGPDEPEWLQEYLNEITRFPKYATNDQVDSTSQCMLACMHRLSELMDLAGTASMQIYDLEW